MRCGSPYDFAAAYVGHLGDYRCPACGHARPALEVRATEIELDGLEAASFTLETPEGASALRLPLPGLYNVYNALAAAAWRRRSGRRWTRSAPGWSGSAPRSAASSASRSATSSS